MNWETTALVVLAALAVLVIFGKRMSKRMPNWTPERKSSASSKLVKHNFDLNDPSIGDPKSKMSALSWVQVVVLRHADDGLRILYAEPGRAHSESADGEYFHQKRTIDSLVKAEFLRPWKDGGFVITALGHKALHTLPERSN